MEIRRRLPHSESNYDTEWYPNAKSNIYPDADANRNSNPNSDANANANANAHANSDTDTDADSNTGDHGECNEPGD